MKLSQKHLAVFDGQHQIDDHQIWQSNLALRKCRTDVTGSDDRMPILLQQDLEHVPHRGVVIENENRLLRGHPCILTGGPLIANMRFMPT